MDTAHLSSRDILTSATEGLSLESLPCLQPVSQADRSEASCAKEIEITLRWIEGSDGMSFC